MVRVRVVAGAFKARRLRAPRGRDTRPTADRVREALFSMLGDVEGLRVLDLFAGSGALAIEAASRGAGPVTLVETDLRALRAIRHNLAAVGLDAEVVRRDALSYLGSGPGPFDLVFLDPPYSSALRLARPLAERIPRATAETGRIVTESHTRQPLELPLPLLRERIFGDTRIAIHRGA